MSYKAKTANTIMGREDDKLSDMECLPYKRRVLCYIGVNEKDIVATENH